MSIPEEAEIVEKNEFGTDITVRSSKAGRSNDFYYRTVDMMIPTLRYAKKEGSDKVAVSVNLVPTFDPVQPQDFFEVVKDEQPEQIKLCNGDRFHFIFIVDRSGSMGSNNRMGMARDALSMFIRSLPKNSSFTLISFGSNYSSTKIAGRTVINFNDETKNYALEQIKTFRDDFGGTEIVQPL